MATIFALATGVAVLALVGAEVKAWRPGVFLFKPLASVLFVLVAHANGALGTPYGTAIVAGLILSVVGDVMLMWHQKGAFLTGLGAFLLAHVAYAVAFVLVGVTWVYAGVALVVLLPAAVMIGKWLLPHVEKGMKPPVLAYMTVITAMVALSLGATVTTGRALMLISAVAFFLSDLSVARDRFVKPGVVNRVWGLPLYYVAQVMFAFTVTAA